MTNNLGNYYLINVNSLNLKTNELLGSQEELGNLYNENKDIKNGLSKSELKDMDLDNDGLVTEEEFEAKFGNGEAYKPYWSAYLSAFNNKMNSETATKIENTRVILKTGNDAYTNGDNENGIKTVIENVMPKENINGFTGSRSIENVSEFKQTIKSLGVNLDKLNAQQMKVIYDKLVSLSAKTYDSSKVEEILNSENINLNSLGVYQKYQLLSAVWNLSPYNYQNDKEAGRTELNNIMKNAGINLSNEAVNSLYESIFENKNIEINSKSIASLIAYIDMQDGNYNGTTTKLSAMDGTISKDGVNKAINNLLGNNSNNEWNSIKNLYIYTISTGFKNAVTYNSSLYSIIADAETNLANSEKAQSDFNKRIDENIKSIKSQMNVQISQYEKMLDSIKDSSSEEYREIANLISKQRDYWKNEIDKLEQERNGSNTEGSMSSLDYSKNILSQKYEIAMLKKGKSVGDTLKNDTALNTLVSKLKDLYDKNYLKEQDELDKNWESTVNDIKAKTSELVKKYPEIAKELKKIVTDFIGNLLKKVESNILNLKNKYVSELNIERKRYNNAIIEKAKINEEENNENELLNKSFEELNNLIQGKQSEYLQYSKDRNNEIVAVKTIAAEIKKEIRNY